MAQAAGDTERRRCGEVWGTGCRAWVQAPDYSHGEHGLFGDLAAQARHSEMTSWAMQQIAERGTIESRCLLASRDDLPSELLSSLAADPYDSVREQVAIRLDCSPALLEVLATDPSAVVRQVVARHPALPTGSLAKLLMDDDLDVVWPRWWEPKRIHRCCEMQFVVVCP